MPSLALAWHLMSVQLPGSPAVIDGVHWDAPPGCPGRAALLVGISRRLGRALAPGEVVVDARVVRDSTSRFAMRLHLVAGAHSELRELTATTCGPLVDTTALLVVHALETAAQGRQVDMIPEPPAGEASVPDARTPPEPTSLPPVEAAPRGPARPVSVVVPVEPTSDGPPTGGLTPSRPPSRGSGLLLRAQGGAGLGVVPGITGVVGLGIGVLWRRVRLEARGSYLAPRTTVRSQTDIRAQLLAGSLHGCLRLGRDALEIPICAGLELGGMRGTAHGPTARQTALSPWLGVVLGVGVSWRLRPRLALWAALEATGGAVRPRFLLRDPGDDIVLFRPAAVSGRLLLGLELRIRDPW